jgi:predicted AlkP superfamily pyrophosphatase or phosphodiesterase
MIGRVTGRLGILAALVAASLLVGHAQPASDRRQLLIVVDALRPDYVTAAVMPNLTALGRRGVVFNRHHAVFPTVTRVNASSISTGAYPEKHGLLGNSVFFPKVNAAAALDTADRNNLLKIGATEGRLLTARTLGEMLQETGKKMLVVSSGSSGSAFLNNHTLAGGAVIHHQYVLPESLGEDVKVLGTPPGVDAPRDVLDRYAVDALLKVGIPRVDPTVTVLWLSGLDSTAHDKGIGDPATVQILRHVDSQIKRIEDELKALNLFDRYNIWVTSDHGFSTYTGGIDLQAIVKPFAGTLADGSPRIVTAGGAIYVRDNDDQATRAIVASLQQTTGVGAIFTREGEAESLAGEIPGTLSFAAARWGHDRSAPILFSPDWTDAANHHGMRGTSRSNGVAGHGSSSPWDIHNTLIAAGPDLKRGASFEVPSGNVDFTPTFLKLLGLAVPESVQGRPLEEAFVNGMSLSAGAVRKIEHKAGTKDGSYSVTGTFSIVTAGGRSYRYLDGTRVDRSSR